jgi:acetoin utilization deacetylase AcuC-like enzyme
VIVYACDHFEVELPPGHRFPMVKYRRLREELLGRGVLAAEEVRRSEPIAVELLELAHRGEYVRAVVEGTLASDRMRRIGLPWSEELVRRSRATVGGTLSAARTALRDGIAGNLAGGTHHAGLDGGAGFCVFNDLAVTARVLLEEGTVTRILILDLDVHQGDGTAAILGAEPRVFTCSVHGAKNFPFEKARSDLDLPLEDGADDGRYLEAVERALAVCMEAGPFDLALYQAGVDALESDKLGRLRVTLAGMRQRDARVLGALRGAGVPVVLTLGGGYSDPIDRTIDAHVATYEEARRQGGPLPQPPASQAP